MPPLPTDFIFPEACKPICEKLLTLPNGYMHTKVQPAMLALGVVDIEDADAVAELMKTRK